MYAKGTIYHHSLGLHQNILSTINGQATTRKMKLIFDLFALKLTNFEL